PPPPTCAAPLSLHDALPICRPPTAWAAMSFHPLEALTGAVVIPFLVFVVPIHAAALLVVLAVMTVMGVTNHMGWDLFPRWLVHGDRKSTRLNSSHVKISYAV